MPQKILAGRADDPSLDRDLVRLKVDQVILSRDPGSALSEAKRLGLKKTGVEVAIAYETGCVTVPGDSPNPPVPREVLQNGVLVARPGIGFPSAVHLERFAAPARLAITDDPRFASVGGAGMLTLVASPAQLGEALVRGQVTFRPPRSIQILLSGRIRPFVCVRDVALELLRRGLGETIERIDRQYGAPVVLEFSGPSARLLSVPDRAVLCCLAPQLGAAGAVFVSDEKTEVYLRDQRRSKAHRALVPDPGAPCDDVVTIDLSAVDPLIMDESGEVRPVRDLDGKPVRQVILGGDNGASLRDMLAAAALLKSKRVPPRLDLLVAPPSRQVLEVLAKTDALVDLIATGARLIEADRRVITGDLYPPPETGLSLRTFDPEPGTSGDKRFVVCSAETLAYAVASGTVGDPRSFKRPVRVTVPRSLPTDDVLVVRKQKGRTKGESTDKGPALTAAPAPRRWSGAEDLTVVTAPTPVLEGPTALVLDGLDQVRWAAREASTFGPSLRAVVAPFIPSGTVPVFAGLGILALTGEEKALEKLRQTKTLSVPSPDSWDETIITVKAGGADLTLTWLAIGDERDWTTTGLKAESAA